ncbi:TIGR03826 family flagellar region protein [Proteiniborus sp.]|uniref:TIGR03826 family flagellar region protein n=1 Tax=Proteiniborus sp. TaxID=2079015 RepID=UPI00331F9982
MGIRNCKKCNRIFADDNFDLCPICRNGDLEEFKIVKDYLYDHPGADIQTVSEVTGVDTKKILKFLREGKLEIRDDSPNLLLDCERCGAPINTGRFCSKCVNEMEREFKSAISGNASSTKKDLGKNSDKMYIAERHKR